MAPAIAAFYDEPQLYGVTAVMAMGFLFNAAEIQHSALFPTPDAFSRLGGDKRRLPGRGDGHWYWRGQSRLRLLGACSDVGHFSAYPHDRFFGDQGRIPGMPRRRAGISSMMHFGGTLTLNGLVAYVAYNAEKS
jgi:hypothetical protein